MRPQDPDRLLRWVGAQLAERRRAQGLTQETLAERLGVGVKYLQRLEAGTENLTLRSLIALANNLNTSPIELMTRPRNALRRPGRPAKSKKTERTARPSSQANRR